MLTYMLCVKKKLPKYLAYKIILQTNLICYYPFLTKNLPSYKIIKSHVLMEKKHLPKREVYSHHLFFIYSIKYGKYFKFGKHWPKRNTIIKYAYYYSNIRVILYIGLLKDYQEYYLALKYSCIKGNLELIVPLIDLIPFFFKNRLCSVALYNLAKYGHWDIIKKIKSMLKYGEVCNLFLGAVRSGNLKKTKKYHTSVYNNFIEHAAYKSGNPEVLQFLRKCGSRKPEFAPDAFHNIPMASYVITNYEFSDDEFDALVHRSMVKAIKHRSMKLIKHIQENFLTDQDYSPYFNKYGI